MSKPAKAEKKSDKPAAAPAGAAAGGEKDDDEEEAAGGGAAARSRANDTALHVIKGALVNVLGPRAAVTCGVRFSTPSKATITIEYQGTDEKSTAKPTAEEMAAIQTECNRLIAANITVKEFVMNKEEAEKKYRANPVNHTFVYDKFPVKAGLSELSIVEIPNVNVNACQGPHLTSTGELKGLFIQKQKYSKANKQHSFSFVCGDAAVEGLKERAANEEKLAAVAKLKAMGKAGGAKLAAAELAKSADGATAAAPAASDKPKDAKAKGKAGDKKAADAAANEKSDAKSAAAAGGVAGGAAGGSASRAPTALDSTTNAIVDGIVCTQLNAALAKGGITTAEAVAALRPELLRAVKAELTAFQSGAYTAGYSAVVQVGVNSFEPKQKHPNNIAHRL